MPNPNYKYEKGKIYIKINGLWIEPKLERYEKLEPIGEPGANGVVLKGIHKRTKRQDAIKIWLPRNRGGKEEINKEQYLAEVQKITKLKDPRIATIHDAWKEKGCFCCSMEFIDGVTYEKWLKENHNMNKRINTLLKIFEAIVFYQSQGIIHGDIHSKNILLDRKGEIHIIDFGTSSISSYEEQANHRENFLMYELIEKTLENQFDNEAFLVKKYKLKGKVEKSDDVRRVVPILFSKSVVSFLHLMIMLNNLSNIINEPEDIYEYCSYIAKGLYLNMNYYYLKVPGENKEKMEIFYDTMYERLEEEEYEMTRYDSNEEERMTFVSLFVYFEEVKKELSDGKINRNFLKEAISGPHLDDAEKIIDILNKSKDLLEFHNILLNDIKDSDEVYSIEREIRGVLYNIIEKIYGNYILYAIQMLNLRIEELKCQKELCEQITRLSSIYCFNNGIEYLSNMQS